MTNDEIISLARSTIQNGRDLVDVMNNADHGKTSGGRSDYGAAGQLLGLFQDKQAAVEAITAVAHKQTSVISFTNNWSADSRQQARSGLTATRLFGLRRPSRCHPLEVARGRRKAAIP